MHKLFLVPFLYFLIWLSGCSHSNAILNQFPEELVTFKTYAGNPVFAGSGTDTWDKHIRERGFILRQEDGYKLWYTGYNPDSSATTFLGLAISEDGIRWTRYPNNPIFKESWVEDVFVVIHAGRYYMFAEGASDIAHFLTSPDGIHWQDKGDLDIRQTDGLPVRGPYGTPTVWLEKGNWYLFYERDDRGIWLAVSRDGEVGGTYRMSRFSEWQRTTKLWQRTRSLPMPGNITCITIPPYMNRGETGPLMSPCRKIWFIGLNILVILSSVVINPAAFWCMMVSNFGYIP